MFGDNAPLAIGDAITGHYSYESSTIDGTRATFSNLNLRFTFGGVTFDSTFAPIEIFRVTDGHIDALYFERSIWNYVPAQNPVPGFPAVEVYGQVIGRLSGISIAEGYYGGASQPPSGKSTSAYGSLTFSDPVRRNVPDTGSTGAYLSVAFAALFCYRRQSRGPKV